MNSDRFNKLVEDRCQKIKDTLASKGKEYSNDNDKLHNFNKAARMTGTTREQALKGMLLKHEVSVSDIIEKTSKDTYPSKEVIDEKIGDIINYYILLEACLVEKSEINNVIKNTIVREVDKLGVIHLGSTTVIHKTFRDVYIIESFSTTDKTFQLDLLSVKGQHNRITVSELALQEQFDIFTDNKSFSLEGLILKFVVGDKIAHIDEPYRYLKINFIDKNFVQLYYLDYKEGYPEFKDETLSGLRQYYKKIN